MEMKECIWSPKLHRDEIWEITAGTLVSTAWNHICEYYNWNLHFCFQDIDIDNKNFGTPEVGGYKWEWAIWGIYFHKILQDNILFVNEHMK